MVIDLVLIWILAGIGNLFAKNTTDKDDEPGLYSWSIRPSTDDIGGLGMANLSGTGETSAVLAMSPSLAKKVHPHPVSAPSVSLQLCSNPPDRPLSRGRALLFKPDGA